MSVHHDVTDMSVQFCQILSIWSGFQMLYVRFVAFKFAQWFKLVERYAILHLESLPPGIFVYIPSCTRYMSSCQMLSYVLCTPTVHQLMYKTRNVHTRIYMVYTCLSIYSAYKCMCMVYMCMYMYIQPCSNLQMYIHVYTMYIHLYTSHVQI